MSLPLVRTLALMALPAALILAQRLAPSSVPVPPPAPAVAAPSAPLPPVETLVALGLPGMDGLAERLGQTARPLGLTPRWAIAGGASAFLAPDVIAFPPPPKPVRPLTMNGHGDYHHLTYFLLRDYLEPLGLPYSVVNFDAHDDARASTERGIDYGNWGRFALERLPHLARIVQVGVPADRMRDWGTWLAPSGFLAGRLDLLPAADLTFFSSAPAPAATLWASAQRDVGSALLGRGGWQYAMRRFDAGAPLAERMPTPYAYVTVDMDGLAASDFDDLRWGTGRLTVDEILAAVHALARQRPLLGADVTGYPPSHQDTLPHPLDRARCEASYRRLVEGLRAALEESAR